MDAGRRELICVLDSPGDPCEAVLDECAAREPRMRASALVLAGVALKAEG